MLMFCGKKFNFKALVFILTPIKVGTNHAEWNSQRYKAINKVVIVALYLVRSPPKQDLYSFDSINQAI
jgi:hypothetical protein